MIIEPELRQIQKIYSTSEHILTECDRILLALEEVSKMRWHDYFVIAGYKAFIMRTQLKDTAKGADKLNESLDAFSKQLETLGISFPNTEKINLHYRDSLSSLASDVLNAGRYSDILALVSEERAKIEDIRNQVLSTIDELKTRETTLENNLLDTSIK